MSQEDSSYRIIAKNPIENRAVAIFYSAEYLKEQENERAKIRMRKPNYNSVPEYGYIQIRVQGWSHGTANPKNWLFIVQDAHKKEIYRDYGTDLPPTGRLNDVGSYYNVTYWSLNNIYLEDGYVFPLYLRVISPDNTPIDITIKKK
jgi:hypothetical protein